MSRTVDLPLAQDSLPSGLHESVYVKFNRARKATAIAHFLNITHRGTLSERTISTLSQTKMATAARSAGVEAPNSPETRAMVRDILRVYNGLPHAGAEIAPGLTRADLARSLSVLADDLRK